MLSSPFPKNVPFFPPRPRHICPQEVNLSMYSAILFSVLPSSRKTNISQLFRNKFRISSPKNQTKRNLCTRGDTWRRKMLLFPFKLKFAFLSFSVPKSLMSGRMTNECFFPRITWRGMEGPFNTSQLMATWNYTVVSYEFHNDTKTQTVKYILACRTFTLDFTKTTDFGANRWNSSFWWGRPSTKTSIRTKCTHISS